MQAFSMNITEDVYLVITIENAVAACTTASLLNEKIAFYQQQLYVDEEWASEKKTMFESLYTKYFSV